MLKRINLNFQPCAGLAKTNENETTTWNKFLNLSKSIKIKNYFREP